MTPAEPVYEYLEQEEEHVNKSLSEEVSVQVSSSENPSSSDF